MAGGGGWNVTSALHRLFTYAKATGAAAVENFTTEALANSTRHAPTPLLKAFASIGVFVSEPLELVATQVSIDGGQLDLLIASGKIRVAVEVKVHSGESGDQLARYLAWASTFEGEHRPCIVVLSKERLSTTGDIRWLSWQEVWRQIREAGGADPLWSDFAVWLEENDMADDSYERVSLQEAATLHHAHGLLKKSIRILAPVARHLNQVWPGSDWPESDADVKKQLVSRFGTWPSFTVQHRASFKCGVTIGIYEDDEDHDAWLGIWIWAPPKRVAERDRIREQGKTLASGWESDPGWELLGAHHRLVEFDGHEQATNWLVERVDELAQVGMLQLLSGTGLAPPGEEAPDPS